MHLLRINNQYASEFLMHLASTTIWAYSNLAELLLSYFFIVLIKHVIEVLLNFIEVQEYTSISTFHLKDNLVYELINRVFLLIIWKIRSVLNLILYSIGLTYVLYELKSVFLVVSNYHLMSRLEVHQIFFNELFRVNHL